MPDFSVATIVFILLGFLSFILAIVDLVSRQSIFVDIFSAIFPAMEDNALGWTRVVDREVPEIDRQKNPILFWFSFACEIFLGMLFWYLAYATLDPNGFTNDPLVSFVGTTIVDILTVLD